MPGYSSRSGQTIPLDVDEGDACGRLEFRSRNSVTLALGGVIVDPIVGKTEGVHGEILAVRRAVEKGHALAERGRGRRRKDPGERTLTSLVVVLGAK